MIEGFNQNLACEPYVARAVEAKSFGTGDKKFLVHTASSKQTLVPLKVVYGLPDKSIYPGDLVYVVASPAWSKEIEVDLGDDKVVKVVIVTLDEVKLVGRKS